MLIWLERSQLVFLQNGCLLVKRECFRLKLAATFIGWITRIFEFRGWVRNDWAFGWLNNWLVDWRLINWLIRLICLFWLIDWLLFRLFDWLIDCLPVWWWWIGYFEFSVPRSIQFNQPQIIERTNNWFYLFFLSFVQPVILVHLVSQQSASQPT